MPDNVTEPGFIDATCSVQKPHDENKVSTIMRKNMAVWKSYLSQYNGVILKFNSSWTHTDSIGLYNDSSGAKIGVLSLVRKLVSATLT